MNRRINGLTIIGIIMLCVFTAHLLTKLLERGDIWWTPKEMAPSLSECRDRVRVYLRDEPIEDYLEKDSLWVVDKDGSRRKIAQDDIRLRLNNWDRRRASLYGGAILDASAVTAGLMLLVSGLFVLPVIKRKQAASTASVRTDDEQGKKP